MRRNALSTSLWLVAISITFAAGTVQAAELVWQVENPFRFFKSTRSFAMHEAAFNAARGGASGPLPVDIVCRWERRLNDPDCKDASTPDRCAETAGPRYAQSRLGWAAQTLGDTCYESDGRPRRYAPVCERKYSWGSAREDYILPEAHTVQIQIAAEQLAGVNAQGIWSWQPGKTGGKAGTQKLARKGKLPIARPP